MKTRIRTRSVKLSDDHYRRARRIAAREQRDIVVTIERAIDLYDRTTRKETAA